MEIKLRESARESVQAATWLVGLASGIVALLATKEGAITALNGAARPAVFLLMLLAVMFGVLQRLLFWIAEQRQLSHFLGLQGYLIGWVAASKAESLPLLSDSWTVQRIVDEIRINFDLDYSFLVEYQSPVEAAREMYNKLCESDERSDRDTLESFAETAMAYAGRAKPEIKSDKSLDVIRDEAKIISRLSRAATWCLALTGLAFFAGLSTLAIALI